MTHKFKNKHYFIKYLILVIPLVILSFHIGKHVVDNERLCILRLIDFTSKYTMGENSVLSMERHSMYLLENMLFALMYYTVIICFLKLSYSYINFDGFYEKRKREGLSRNPFTMIIVALFTLLYGIFKLVAFGLYFGAGGWIALMAFGFLWQFAVPILKYYIIFVMPILGFNAYLTKKMPYDRVPKIWKMLLFDLLIVVAMIITLIFSATILSRIFAVILNPFIPRISERSILIFIAGLWPFITLSVGYWMLVLKNEYLYKEKRVRQGEQM